MKMKIFVDQMNQTIRLSETPHRVVSLVPSQTELLFDLGLENEVVGITKFCIHPEKWFKTKNRVGGTKNVDLEKVKSLQPDLIIGNKEENSQEDIEKLKEIAPVWMSDIFNLEDAQKALVEIGRMTDKTEEVFRLNQQIQLGFDELNSIVHAKPIKTVLYFIWNDPWFVAGKNTFIDAMLKHCGFENLAKNERYPEVEKSMTPDLIFLSSEPYPFKEIHREEFKMTYPNSKIVLVDGEMFSWYGSRLTQSPHYFKELIKGLEN